MQRRLLESLFPFHGSLPESVEAVAAERVAMEPTPSPVPDQLLVKTKHSRVRKGQRSFLHRRHATIFRAQNTEAASRVRFLPDSFRSTEYLRFMSPSRVYAESDVPTTTNNAAPHAREPMRRALQSQSVAKQTDGTKKLHFRRGDFLSIRGLRSVSGITGVHPPLAGHSRNVASLPNCSPRMRRTVCPSNVHFSLGSRSSSTVPDRRGRGRGGGN